MLLALPPGPSRPVDTLSPALLVPFRQQLTPGRNFVHPGTRHRLTLSSSPAPSSRARPTTAPLNSPSPRHPGATTSRSPASRSGFPSSRSLMPASPASPSTCRVRVHVCPCVRVMFHHCTREPCCALCSHTGARTCVRAHTHARTHSHALTHTTQQTWRASTRTGLGPATKTHAGQARTLT